VNLVLLIGVQLLLGVSTWMLKYGMPAWATSVMGETGHFNRASGTLSAAIVTAHGAVGSLIVALGVVLALHVARGVGVQSPARRATAIPLAGVIA
jgi:cytochrome c oxidase assembly protein subunit 15